MTTKQQHAIDEWQKRSPLVAWRGKRTQVDFAKLIGLKTVQLLQHWERGVRITENGVKEMFPPTKWLRAMLRAGVSVNFKELHDWFDARPKIRV